MASSTKYDDAPPVLRQYHSHFASPDADIVLCSVESTYYRVPSFTLRTTSGFFRKILPPPPGYHATHAQYPLTPIPSPIQHHHIVGAGVVVEEPILVNLKDSVVERVLRMLSGLRTPKWGSFDELEDAVTLIEEWDAPGPLSVVRAAITAPLFLSEPLRLYAIASHFNWDEEARLASTYTLTLSLYDEKHQSMLERLSSKHLMALLNFHRRRRDEFKAFIDSEEPFNAGNATHYHCTGCGEETDNHSWRELKSRMFLEMDQRPLGDTLSGLDMEEWPESTACWSAKCHKEDCGRLNYNKLSTLRDIKECIDRLPSTI